MSSLHKIIENHIFLFFLGNGERVARDNEGFETRHVSGAVEQLALVIHLIKAHVQLLQIIKETFTLLVNVYVFITLPTLGIKL